MTLILDKNDHDWYPGNLNAISIFEQNLDKVNGDALPSNPNAISILEQNLDKVRWYYLSRNPNVISILEQNLDKLWKFIRVNLRVLSPNAIPILLDNIYWDKLSENPSK